MVAPIAVGVGAAIAAAVAKIFASEAIRWIAWRTFIAGCIMVLLPLALTKFTYYFLEKYFGLLQETLTGFSGLPVMQGPVQLQLTGLGAWLAVKLHLPESVAYIMAASSARMVLSFIPFIGK